MLKTDPISLMQEVEAAEKLRKRHLEYTDEMIRQYAGKTYDPDRAPDQPAPENHKFEWLSLVTPQIIFNNPDIIIESRRSGIDYRPIVQMLQHGLNEWAENVNLWKTLERVWYDTAFSFGIVHRTIMPVSHYPGLEGLRAIQPVCNRIPPHRFIIDAHCDSISSARFMGHMWRRDKDDLLNDPDYNHDEIQKLAADADLSKDRLPGDAGGDYPSRNEIIGYEIWIPEINETDDPMFNGTIFTLASACNSKGDAVEARWIRDPRPFYGPKSGPYTMFGAYIVPNQIYPLSPLAATQAQEQELNAHAVAASKAAAAWKQIVLYDKADKGAATQIQKATHGDFVGVEGLDKNKILPIETGGVAPEQYNYLQYLRDRRDRSTGLRDSDRGGADKTRTATEIEDRAEQRNSRIALLQNTFVTDTEAVIQGVAWYMWNTDTVAFPLGPKAAEIIKPRPKSLPPIEDAEQIAFEQGLDVEAVRQKLEWNPEVVFYGGEMLHNNRMSYEELLIKVSPHSMQRANTPLQQYRRQQAMAWIASIIPMIPQAPEMDWVKMADDYGETLNMRDLGAIIAPYVQRVRKNAMQMQMMAGQQQQMAQAALAMPAGLPDTEQMGMEAMAI